MPIRLCLAVGIVLAAGLACGQAEPSPAPRISRLPTLTPTAALAAGVDLPPAAQPAATAAPGTTSESPPLPDGWQFSGLRTAPAETGDLQLTGELQNTSGQPQFVNDIAATFFNEQGQMVADPAGGEGLWPAEIVQPGDWIPFKIIVPGLQAAADYQLSVSAQPAVETIRHDFQFTAQETSMQAEQYCLTGLLQNPGDALQNYLVIGLVLYDEQNNVVNYSSYNELYFAGVTGDQSLDFEICVSPPNQNVARYQLRAWGQ